MLSEALRDDVRLVARRSGYTGDMEDFLRAAETAPIRELSIPPNTLLPAMSTRSGNRGQTTFSCSHPLYRFDVWSFGLTGLPQIVLILHPQPKIG